MEVLELEPWLRTQCDEYNFAVRGIFQAHGTHEWPLLAADEEDLVSQLGAGGHLLPLPKEPAALANVLEVSIVDFLIGRVDRLTGAQAVRGTERGYPDLELSGDVFGGGYHAVDVKIAQRKRMKRGVATMTQSRVTLYTGNTYFRHPTVHWPGTMRPFADYASHLDVIGIYTLNSESSARVEDLELIVQPPWKIASRQRSSTTREYIGGVTVLRALREGRGEFASPDEFYRYWRGYRFKVGEAVSRQLAKLLRDADGRQT
jgi:hypothetical protein